ncbi:Olfactory receptor 187 [Microtus ochrogaster]|uniref:Olfactory receptor 187 n=1 Tax=Microtus ochrogaster TaxID=79684 RepID=A0A8J6FYB6_MICOH|nr:Olfactory receptor 187 [Microtus ochrogaster]
MTVGNQTLVTELVLIGLTDQPRLQVLLFLVFLIIYLITVVGNLGLIALIWKEPHLHIPMYLFLGSLAFADACASSSVAPKMLVNFLSKDHKIFLAEWTSSEDMGTGNATVLTQFVLTGLTHLPQWKIPLFLLFLVIYLITIVGNLGLIALIWNDPGLHIPMYLFLGSLAFVDTWLSSTVTPKMLLTFIAKRLTHLPQWEIPLFLLFLVIYLITIVGNLGLITLIWNDPDLHIPMYLFLGSLAFVDTWLSSTVTPKMLFDFFAKSKLISLSECMTQFFSFGISATTECFLLAAMAYDRYIAICKPLHYPVIMTNRLCVRLITLSFVEKEEREGGKKKGMKEQERVKKTKREEAGESKIRQETQRRGEESRGEERRGEEGRGEQKRGEQRRAEESRGEERRGGERRAEKRRAEESRGEQRRGEERRGEQRRGEERRAEERRGEERRGEESRGEQRRGEESRGEESRGEQRRAEESRGEERRASRTGD